MNLTTSKVIYPHLTQIFIEAWLPVFCHGWHVPPALAIINTDYITEETVQYKNIWRLILESKGSILLVEVNIQIKSIYRISFKLKYKTV